MSFVKPRLLPSLFFKHCPSISHEWRIPWYSMHPSNKTITEANQLHGKLGYPRRYSSYSHGLLIWLHRKIMIVALMISSIAGKNDIIIDNIIYMMTNIVIIVIVIVIIIILIHALVVCSLSLSFSLVLSFITITINMNFHNIIKLIIYHIPIRIYQIHQGVSMLDSLAKHIEIIYWYDKNNTSIW